MPIVIKKRGGSAVIILPKNIKAEDRKVFYDDTMIQALGKACKWKQQIEEGKYMSLADIARKENVNPSYLSKVFNLNFLSPKIVKAILTGTQPKTLKLQGV